MKLGYMTNGFGPLVGAGGGVTSVKDIRYLTICDDADTIAKIANVGFRCIEVLEGNLTKYADNIDELKQILQRCDSLAYKRHPIRENRMGKVRMALKIDVYKRQQEKKARQLAEEKERRLQNVTLAIQDRYGKNAVLKGMNLMEGGTTIARNGQIGGHKAGDE